MNKPIDEEAFREAYVSLEGKVTADDQLKERTKALVANRKAQTRPSRKSSRFAEKNSLAKRLLPAAACFALAACLMVAGGFMQDGKAGDASSDESLSASGNFFTLVAYADELAEREENGVVLGIGNFAPFVQNAGYRYDPGAGSLDMETVDVSVGFFFDVTTQGANIETIDYSLSGPDASFVIRPTVETEDGGHPGEVPGDRITTSFSASSSEESVVPLVRFDYVLGEPTKSEYDRLEEEYDATGDVDKFLGSLALLIRDAAGKLTETTVTVTANFEDGTSQTKAYGFGLVSSFDERIGQMLAGEWDYENPPSLFVLVEK